MNERDSEEVLSMLIAQGYEIAAQPEQADVILLNTCSVRQHGQDPDTLLDFPRSLWLTGRRGP